MEDVNYLMTMSTKAQAWWSLRNDVNSCDTTRQTHHHPIRALSWSLTWVTCVISALQNLSRGLKAFQDLSHLPLLDPEIDLSLLPSSNISVCLALLCVGYRNTRSVPSWSILYLPKKQKLVKNGIAINLLSGETVWPCEEHKRELTHEMDLHKPTWLPLFPSLPSHSLPSLEA